MTQPTRLVSASVALALVLALPACAQKENPELQWARTALQRNPNVDIIAVDASAGVFTLRDKHTGSVQVIGLKELAATPISQLALLTAPPTAPAAAAPSPLEPEAAPTPPLDQPETPPPAHPAAAAPPPTQTAAAKPYTIERSGDQVKVTGPGISVVSSGARSAVAQNETAQRSVDPIICEGPRMLRFDSREIHVDGDAIIARGGCELYITNSTVIGARTGLVVQDAVVHIANSRIEGSTASFEAGNKARLFVRGSTFYGVPRRDEGSSVQDQGGNQWR